MCPNLLKDSDEWEWISAGTGKAGKGKKKKKGLCECILPLSDCLGNFCQMLKIMIVVANIVLQAQWRCQDCRAPTRANEMPGPYANSGGEVGFGATPKTHFQWSGSRRPLKNKDTGSLFSRGSPVPSSVCDGAGGWGWIPSQSSPSKSPQSQATEWTHPHASVFSGH